MTRYNRASLHSMPEIRTSGAFGDEEETLRWIQPAEMWQAQLLHHHGTFTVNGFAFSVQPFDLVVLPPGARCEVNRFGHDVYVYDYFGFVPTPSDRDVVSLPLKASLGEEAGHFWDLEFRRALNRLQYSRTLSQVCAWHLLLSVAQPEHAVIKSVYTEQAEKLIEERLGNRIVVAELCKDLDVSQSQLTRLFMAEHGRSPLQYILDRRAQQAHKLLTRSTLPIKQVASNIGMPNVHQFNRFIRERYGASPTALRKHRGFVDVYREQNLEKGRGQS